MTVSSIAGPGTHVVQFYESERFLYRAVTSFLSRALQNGEPAVMISRHCTFRAVTAQLGASGANVDDILFLEVEAALGGFMDGPTPDPRRVEEAFATLFTRLGDRARGRTTWIYGEMVDVLCRGGGHAAAVGLEELWNRVCSGPRFAAMCGYGIQSFDEDLHANQFRAVCRQHTHVIPAEGYVDAPDERSRLEQVAFLQQRARALAGALAEPPSASVTPVTPALTTVYIIDDDESVRRSLSRLLASMGFPVHAYASGEAFLGEVDRTANGCLLVDIQLVGMSGAEVQERMTRANWGMPVIAMSGAHNAKTEADALRFGATTFLRKPFSTRALLTAIERALAKALQ